MDTYQITAKTLSGLEDVLAEEIRAIGGKQITKLKRAVSFAGNDALMMQANLCLRTALQILIPCAKFKATHEDELYQEIFQLPWPDIFNLENTFSVQAVVSGGIFTHSKYVALKTKDAIADKFREQTGKRPNVDTEYADYQINIHIQRDECTVSLNTSGQSLDRRGYRLKANEAPINEALAAGIILNSGWDSEMDFYDPMAGSGTFGIEAAMISSATPPGLNRDFAFQHWNDFNQDLFLSVKRELKEQIKQPKSKIYSSDISIAAVRLIQENAQNANMLQHLDISEEDFFTSQKKTETGVLILNPPYGERLEVSDIKSYYKQIGDQLKQEYKNCEAWVISSNIEGMKGFGLKPESRKQVYNGGLECILQHYKLF